MRAFFWAFVLVVSLGLTSASTVDAEEPGIQSVISSQIDAFKADDFATAFTFAAPNIQGIFRSPENFGRMVSQGYPMVWRPAEVTYLSQSIDGNDILQNVRIVDGDGTTHVLEYRMEQVGDVWRISGVRIIDQPGVSA